MDSVTLPFLDIAEDLDHAGLIWQPEIGDEVAQRDHKESISILVDPHGMSPMELRTVFLWLPTAEQIVTQFEARQAVLFHLGLDLDNTSIGYKAIVQSPVGKIESNGDSLRLALGNALRSLLLNCMTEEFH